MKRSPFVPPEARSLRTWTLVWALVLVAAPVRAVPGFIVDSVSDLNDAVPGDGLCEAVGTGECTLRAAIEESNAAGVFHSIELGSGRYVLTIPGAGEDDCLTGDLDVLVPLLIQGQGADQTIVDANGLDRVFHLQGPFNASLHDLTVTGGVVLESSGFPSGLGGGILAGNARLTLDTVRVSDNKALAGGGIGALDINLLEIKRSEIVGNEIQLAPGHVSAGGALYSESATDGSVDISESTLHDNGCSNQAAADCFGGVRIHETSEVDDFFMVNSTISGNEGHGLSLGEAAGVLESCTIYGNTGYGIHVFDTGLVLRGVLAENTIFANNGIQDCFLFAGEWDFAGGLNLSSDNTCTLQPAQDDLINTDPDLHPLFQYRPPIGRIARVHHPRWLAPVVDAGDAFPLTHDQDLYERGEDGDDDPNDASDDIGSVEARECGGQIVAWIHGQTITSGVYEACQKVQLGSGLFVNGTADFNARDAIELYDGLEISASSTVVFDLVRDAARPPL